MTATKTRIDLTHTDEYLTRLIDERIKVFAEAEKRLLLADETLPPQRARRAAAIIDAALAALTPAEDGERHEFCCVEWHGEAGNLAQALVLGVGKCVVLNHLCTCGQRFRSHTHPREPAPPAKACTCALDDSGSLRERQTNEKACPVHMPPAKAQRVEVVAHEWISGDKQPRHELRWADDDEMLEEHGYAPHPLIRESDHTRLIAERDARIAEIRAAAAAASDSLAIALDNLRCTHGPGGNHKPACTNRTCCAVAFVVNAENALDDVLEPQP